MEVVQAVAVVWKFDKDGIDLVNSAIEKSSVWIILISADF